MEETCYVLVNNNGFEPNDDSITNKGIFVARTESFAKKLQKRASEPVTIFSVAIGKVILATENLIKTDKVTILAEID